MQIIKSLLPLLLLLGSPLPAGDWPTYRGDNQRRGIATESLVPPLTPAWEYHPLFGPCHAWGDPQPKPVEKKLELPRIRFDDTFHVAAAAGLVFFGSSADYQIRALKIKTGDLAWKFFTGGPVRLAPTYWAGKVFAGSDDGRVYCLDAKKGTLVWSFSAAPSPQKILGNAQMISIWPVRSGVMVEDGVAYFTAGVFPAEGLYLYALNAETGKLLWRNDTYGKGGQGTISPQGYMLASKTKLFVPSGRTMPAAFNRADGRFLFHRNFSWRRIGLFGGTYNVLDGDLLYNGTEQLIAVNENNGQLAFTEGKPATTITRTPLRIILSPERVFTPTKDGLTAWHRGLWTGERKVKFLATALKDLQKKAKKQKKLTKQVKAMAGRLNRQKAANKILRAAGNKLKIWEEAGQYHALALAGETLYAGADDRVVAISLTTGQVLWSGVVRGKAKGLAVCNGHLLVSTDRGSTHCFTRQPLGPAKKISESYLRQVYPPDAFTQFHKDVASRILQESKSNLGYGLILGGGDGRLAIELARRTKLKIIVVVKDRAQAAATRRALAMAGLYGKRITVEHGGMKHLASFPDYFANLIVIQEGFLTGKITVPTSRILSWLKPCGGYLFAGQPPEVNPPKNLANAPELLGWLRNLAANPTSRGLDVKVDNRWLVAKRGPLPGAGDWTHQHGNPANTASSTDEAIKGPLGILWYGAPGPNRMPSRHAANVAPLTQDGRVFVQGENVIMAYDAYNGTPLWTREIPGALRLHMRTLNSNLALDRQGLYVAVGPICLKLNPVTGKTIRTLLAPSGKPPVSSPWSFTAVSDGILFGSRGNSLLFAMEVSTGKCLWTHHCKRSCPATICLGDGRLYFVDRMANRQDRKKALKGISYKPGKDRKGKPIPPDIRRIVALEMKTGRQLWVRPHFFSDCVKVGKAGGELTAMYSSGILVICGQPWNGHFWTDFFKGKFSRRSLIAIKAKSGKVAWSGHRGYRCRPLIIGDRIIAEPWAYELKSGAQIMRTHPLTGKETPWQISRPGHHCGQICGAAKALFYRSGTTAFYDLIKDYGTAHFGGQRPGCWINMIPANGIVTMPEASSGCVCPFSLHCTIAFTPRHRPGAIDRHWGMYSAAGKTLPIKRLAINFGAPGDRRDQQGKLWLAWPRPYNGRLVLKFKTELTLAKGGGYFRHNPDFLRLTSGKNRPTTNPWIFTSGCQGLTSCVIPIRKDKKKKPASYTVRLYLYPEGPGKRVFSLKLQGKRVLKDFNLTRRPGKTYALIREFKQVLVKDKLHIECTAKDGLPLLCGLEIEKN